MEIGAFVDFLTERGCDSKPHEGGNLTAPSIIITRKFPNSNISKRVYLTIYPNGLVSKSTIRHCCHILLLEEPTPY